MLWRSLVVIGCALLLSGCGDLIAILWPRNSATHEEAELVVKRCQLPASAYWRVTEEGVFVFGRTSPQAPQISKQHTDCIFKWIQDNRIKAAFVAWEADGR